mmetsp:Transcript_11750/g.16940  ORF Transcript_11750/g.16940 Transcript_11750/m.16940 type:complete len:372 (+) Transcript_11750:329-1444(+)
MMPLSKSTIFFAYLYAVATQALVAFRPCTRLHVSSSHASHISMRMTSGPSESDDEIQRLLAQAAKFRAEAAALEAARLKDMALAAERAFNSFDTNQDGQVSLQELKNGLEKMWETELSESRAKELMEAFDASGDGSLRLEEFVTVDKFRNKLDLLVREETLAAKVAKKNADEEAVAAKFEQAKLEFLNDRPPTNVDKLVSVLPYLFPLMDGLQYGRFFLGNQDGSNPFILAVALLYTFYRSIPFSGFVAFFALNILSGNPKINRLVRFNMQQAIFVDFALFFPGILLGASQMLPKITGASIAPSVVETAYDLVFFSMLGVFAYVTISSLLGITPDKLPIISKAVNDRMPSIDMFDEDGTFSSKRDDKDETK